MHNSKGMVEWTLGIGPGIVLGGRPLYDGGAKLLMDGPRRTARIANRSHSEGEGGGSPAPKPGGSGCVQ